MTRRHDQKNQSIFRRGAQQDGIGSWTGGSGEELEQQDFRVVAGDGLQGYKVTRLQGCWLLGRAEGDREGGLETAESGGQGAESSERDPGGETGENDDGSKFQGEGAEGERDAATI